MHYLILTLLLALAPWPASAVCSGHEQAIVATPEGTFRMCPKEVDARVPPQPVPANFYSHCDVTGIWAEGTAKVTVMNPVPGVSVVVGFPNATGSGGATASCTNLDNLVSPISASAITFRKPLTPPQPPVMVPVQ